LVLAPELFVADELCGDFPLLELEGLCEDCALPSLEIVPLALPFASALPLLRWLLRTPVGESPRSLLPLP
jgi:hypothetical protein